MFFYQASIFICYNFILEHTLENNNNEKKMRNVNKVSDKPDIHKKSISKIHLFTIISG